MEKLIDIAKQNLDDYSMEIYSCAVLNKLKKEDVEAALINVRKLERDLERCLYNR